MLGLPFLFELYFRNRIGATYFGELPEKPVMPSLPIILFNCICHIIIHRIIEVSMERNIDKHVSKFAFKLPNRKLIHFGICELSQQANHFRKLFICHFFIVRHRLYSPLYLFTLSLANRRLDSAWKETACMKLNSFTEAQKTNCECKTPFSIR